MKPINMHMWDSQKISCLRDCVNIEITQHREKKEIEKERKKRIKNMEVTLTGDKSAQK